MESLLKSLLAGLVGLMAFAAPAAAHPHVYVTMVSELMYAADGSVTGVRHAWTFDDMFSTFALQGLEQKEKGKFSREELAPLAEVNVTSLKEYDFFTYAQADGNKPGFNDAKDYWLEYKNEVLVLHFTLMFKKPVKTKALDLEVYDPNYFVDFKFVDKDAVKLTGAPATCKASVVGPKDMSVAQGKKLSESLFSQPNSTQNWGAEFSSKIAVKC